MKMVKELEEEMKNLGVDSDSEEKENEPQLDQSKEQKPLDVNKQRIQVNRPNIGLNSSVPSYALKHVSNKSSVKPSKQSISENSKVRKNSSPKHTSK